MYKDWGVAVIVGLILLIIVVVIFFVWLFWTFAGMIMDYIGATKYGWVFQLVLTLILFAVTGTRIKFGKIKVKI